MNRSQHTSTDDHDSNLAVSRKTHSNCFLSTPLAEKTRTTALCHSAPLTEARNLQLLAPWLFPERHIQGAQPSARRLTSEIAPRPPLWTTPRNPVGAAEADASTATRPLPVRESETTTRTATQVTQSSVPAVPATQSPTRRWKPLKPRMSPQGEAAWATVS